MFVAQSDAYLYKLFDCDLPLCPQFVLGFLFLIQKHKEVISISLYFDQIDMSGN